MSGFDSLQRGSFLGRYDRDGCETRVRPESGRLRDEIDAKVLAAGGDWIALPTPQSRQIGGGRMMRRHQPQLYAYRIPTEAFG
jgi:hypothetical protein